ncbi:MULTISPECIES: hypothetical protein [Modicisalibacter]|nr:MULTISPECIES: hypothetical protein [Halomonadaceae]
MLMLGIPVAFLSVLAAAIFGGQVIADHNRDSTIQQAIASRLDTASPVELLKLQEVQYGYGVCGLYRTADADQGVASFFYNTVNDRLTLDVKSDDFQSYCNLANLCS